MGKRIFRKELFLRESLRNGTPQRDIAEALDVWVMKCDGLEIGEMRKVTGLINAKYQLPDEWFEEV